ncbi:uncharacterized protein Z519_04538 [Cladophialophora bantiana CBS 173.52]|uniref:DUF7708 domain-containing protein n=1 Tax=Cladophialophora bantiana (strain ATCC 10958 / CBS 173.52 / CDC B-1940 / NIH 8579) TaxID=1442370 RepID=A0A0D2G7G9_CLAB1|nr:uncharacterized protein Z519_04538 [Cladophialophora bantiana CBS 173.52]KIW94562.1 hypothetical protein Z519_04538 [Cladophialophora bantiana CBS 173.52]
MSKEFLKKELSPRGYESIFPSGASNNSFLSNQSQSTPPPAHSIDTFTAALEQARQKYEDKSLSNNVPVKVKAWLTSLSARILFFGNILDVLAQQHPECASLAWGTFKFLFIVCKVTYMFVLQNHFELISKIAKCASRIADLLPQDKLLLVLYPANAMREAVACLFASILKFFRLAVQFCKDGRFKHSVKATSQPWSPSFQGLYEDVTIQAGKVHELAAIAAKAELRDAHVESMELKSMSSQMNSEVAALKSTVNELRTVLEQKVDAHGGLLTRRSPTPFIFVRQSSLIYRNQHCTKTSGLISPSSESVFAKFT